MNRIVHDKIPKVIYESDNGIPFKGKICITADKTIDELMGKPKPPEDEAFVIIFDGGLGDTICMTPMIESAKYYYPDKKIIVGVTYPELLFNNPNIDVLYDLKEPTDLYDTWIKPLKHFGSVLNQNLYFDNVHKLFPGPISMAFCYMYGIPFIHDVVKLYLTAQEVDNAKKFVSTFNKAKKIIVIHGTGARPGVDPTKQVTPNKDWFIDYWNELTFILKKNYHIIQVGSEFDVPIKHVDVSLLGKCSVRETAALLRYSYTFIAIDSFVSHVGPAVGKYGIVITGRSNPYIVGHALNKNLWVENSCDQNDMHCGRPQGIYGDDELFRGTRRPWVCKTRSCLRAIKPYDILLALKDIK